MTMAVILFSKWKRFTGCSLFGSTASICADSKALVRVFQPGPKLFKVERQTSANMVKPSVLHSGPQFATFDKFFLSTS